MNKVINTSVGILALLLVLRPAYGREGWAPADGSWLEVIVPEAEERPEETDDNIQAGKEIYLLACAECHGEEGDGKGGAVFGPEGDLRILPRPRDFQKALYKFRTTLSQYPLDKDLFRTITRGVPGTAMPHFDDSKSPTGLTEDDRWLVVYAVKDFARTRFARAKDRKKIKAIDLPQPPERTDALLERGQEIYNEQCIKCHGERGRGEGELTIKDSEWDLPIMPTNFTRAENFKTGATVREIYRATSTGLISTMTAFKSDDGGLSDEDRWAVAHYIDFKFIQHEDPKSRGIVLKAAYVSGDIPDDPSDAAWDEVEAITIPLAGQILEDPKLWTPSILSVEVRALYNEKEIAFLLQWDDREWSVGEAPDRAAIQFPVEVPDGPQKPFFLYGQRGRPVNIWQWHGDPSRSVEELNATGLADIKVQPDEPNAVSSWAEWSDGRWSLIMRRSLVTEDAKNDMQFEIGRVIPVAFFLWNGFNDENGTRMSTSCWYYLRLEPPFRPVVLADCGIVMLVVISLLWLTVRKARKLRANAANMSVSEQG